MVSEAMAVQAESVGIRSNSVFTSENAISLRPQLKDQFSCGNNDFSPKVRKPYTITKQRERWTEEEHRKFLEALKLYGRAWRKIEEHVGSKTAVQIRSHAQKFFFKVSRDPSGGNTNPEDPIEIPPPRPKRKPVHPYPRKIVQSPSKENVISDHSNRSLSSKFSFSEHENHSPKSVLSVMGSEMVGSNGSETPDGSLSPVSCASGIHNEILALGETNPSSEDSGSHSSLVSIPTAKLPVKLELFTQESDHAKESSTEETSSRSLKLFGRTVLVTESQRPSMSPETSKPPSSNEHREKSLPRHLPQAVKALYVMHFNKESSDFPAPTSPTPMPLLWSFYSSLNFPVVQFNKPESVKESFESKLPEDDNSTNVDTSLELDSLQRKASLYRKEKEQESVFKFKPSSRSAFSQLRIRTDKTRRGFVPYKKNIADEETRVSTISGDERKEKRTDLCL